MTKPKIRDYLELVKFGHTLFALPFALASMLVAAHGLPHLRIIAWIVVAMVSARTAAMGFNRIVDRDIDARNPRTANREIPAGKVTVAQAATLVVISAAIFVAAAAELNMLAAILALPTLAMLFFYSYCKRFTAFSHVVLGICLGIAPVGAWVAVRQRIDLAPVLLCIAVTLWVAGFDIIYATMDVEFDKEAGLRSMVQKLGIPMALNLSRLLHIAFVAFLFAFGHAAGLGALYNAAVIGIAAFLIYEHILVKPNDLRRVNAAFFTVNGIISVCFLVAVGVGVFVGR